MAAERAAPARGVIVISSYLPSEGEKPYRSKEFRVVALPCRTSHDGLFDYSRGLQAVWGSDSTIVNVEHDMECSDGLIQNLLDCPHPLCAHAYLLRKSGPYAYRNGPLPPAGGYEDHWLKGGEEWATFGGIGLVKITPEARVRPLPEREWSTVDIVVTKACEGPEVVPGGHHLGRRWHIHWPAIKHASFNEPSE